MWNIKVPIFYIFLFSSSFHILQTFSREIDLHLICLKYNNLILVICIWNDNLELIWLMIHLFVFLLWPLYSLENFSTLKFKSIKKFSNLPLQSLTFASTEFHKEQHCLHYSDIYFSSSSFIYWMEFLLSCQFHACWWLNAIEFMPWVEKVDSKLYIVVLPYVIYSSTIKY